MLAVFIREIAQTLRFHLKKQQGLRKEPIYFAKTWFPIVTVTGREVIH